MSADDGLDLALDDAQQALADTVAQLCREHCTDAIVRGTAGSFPTAPWQRLAELGVLSIATPEGDGGALEWVAALESLGRAAFPGPLVGTLLAAQLLPAAERARVVAGEAVVAVGTPPLLGWAPCAQLFVELEEGLAWLATPVGPIEALATLGGEPWGRLRLERGAALGSTLRAQALADTALAAYLAAAGRRLVGDAAEHARTRRQFGRALAGFQAVSHPLADAVVGLDAAATLARVAAFEWDAGDPFARARAGAARLSAARAATTAAHVAHQAFGALGITLDGPAFHLSRRILQLAAAPPGPAAARAALLEAAGLPESP